MRFLKNIITKLLFIFHFNEIKLWESPKVFCAEMTWNTKNRWVFDIIIYLNAAYVLNAYKRNDMICQLIIKSYCQRHICFVCYFSPSVARIHMGTAWPSKGEDLDVVSHSVWLQQMQLNWQWSLIRRCCMLISWNVKYWKWL